MTAGLARVTITTPRRRLDVALPEHVPVAELLPEVLRHAGDGLADDGERHGGWVLRRADGAALSGGQPLQPQGVRDGELLFLVPARVRWAEPEYDDVVEAIAEGARRRGAAWSAGATRVATLGAAAVLLALGLAALLRTGSPGTLAAGASVLLLLAGTLAARAHRDGPAGAVLAGCALPYAFVAGSGGRLEPSDLLGGAAAVLAGSVLGALGVAAHQRVFAAGGIVGLLGGLTALAAYGLPAKGAAALLLAALACGIGVLPLIAIRLGRLPLPPVTPPSGGDPGFGRGAAGAWTEERGDEGRGRLSVPGARPGEASASQRGSDRPDRARVFDAVARTEELLGGMLIGHAVLAAAAAAVLVVTGGLAGRLLVAVCAAILSLRSRLFAAVQHRVPLLAAALVGLAALAGAVVAEAGGSVLPGLAAGGVLAALVIVAAGAAYAERPPSPYLGRAADIFDTVMVVSVVPIACAVLDLYAKARAL
ncbi:type VII secretion integral membrane protein EccD [Phytohabitans rumicis]|uniref:type VII secretion integral membrane protein EccD n=1 Tax=Phytohabitans rumicis TaxID=1076125 RepID=UPI0015661BA6|nr:type VII secretion integral membrane protein EccD [Phytohabitans rumicis]